MEFRGILNSQNTFEKEEQSWKTWSSEFWNLQQSFSNQNSMVPA